MGMLVSLITLFTYTQCLCLSPSQTWTYRPVHQDGRDGLWDGMLLSPNHLPSLECE